MADMGSTGRQSGHLWLRLVVAAGLALDAFVHWDLAAQFDPIVGSGRLHVSQGQLFRLEAVLAVVAAVLVLLVRRRWAVLLALLVGLAGLAAVLVYRYVDVGALGPLPDMYDPTWYAEKTLSVVGEAVASIGAAALLFVMARQDRATAPSAAQHEPGARHWAERGQ